MSRKGLGGQGGQGGQREIIEQVSSLSPLSPLSPLSLLYAPCLCPSSLLPNQKISCHFPFAFNFDFAPLLK
ncbi:hypothetical protein FBB35_16135 [Nostoc sp. TCL240-02]|nr:hypothetical protein FBB35_16135 [Nostoc sp. TCL240-02]